MHFGKYQVELLFGYNSIFKYSYIFKERQTKKYRQKLEKIKKDI